MANGTGKRSVHRYSVIEYLIKQGVTLDQIVNTSVENLSDKGFVYGDKTVEVPPEIFEHLSKHVQTLKTNLIFPGAHDRLQKTQNLVLGLATYLKKSGRTLKDIGITSSYAPRQEVKFDNMVSIKQFLQKKLGTPEQPPKAVNSGKAK
jgi:hypothetical protein